MASGDAPGSLRARLSRLLREVGDEAGGDGGGRTMLDDARRVAEKVGIEFKGTNVQAAVREAEEALFGKASEEQDLASESTTNSPIHTAEPASTATPLPAPIGTSSARALKNVLFELSPADAATAGSLSPQPPAAEQYTPPVESHASASDASLAKRQAEDLEHDQTVTLLTKNTFFNISETLDEDLAPGPATCPLLGRRSPSGRRPSGGSKRPSGLESARLAEDMEPTPDAFEQTPGKFAAWPPPGGSYFNTKIIDDIRRTSTTSKRSDSQRGSLEQPQAEDVSTTDGRSSPWCMATPFTPGGLHQGASLCVFNSAMANANEIPTGLPTSTVPGGPPTVPPLLSTQQGLSCDVLPAPGALFPYGPFTPPGSLHHPQVSLLPPSFGVPSTMPPFDQPAYPPFGYHTAVPPMAPSALPPAPPFVPTLSPPKALPHAPPFESGRNFCALRWPPAGETAQVEQQTVQGQTDALKNRRRRGCKKARDPERAENDPLNGLPLWACVDLGDLAKVVVQAAGTTQPADCAPAAPQL